MPGQQMSWKRYLAKEAISFRQELKELEDGTRTAELNVRRETLEREVEDLERKIKSVNEERIGRAGDKRIAESEQKSYEERLAVCCRKDLCQIRSFWRR